MLVRNVRDVDHHSQTVHLVDHVLAEFGQPFFGMWNRRVVDVAGAVGPISGVGPCERHVAHAERVILAQECKRIFNGVAAFNAHERGELVFAVRLLNAFRGGDKHHLIRMPGYLLLDRVDQFQRAMGELALVERRFDPDGKELRAQIPFVNGIQIHVAAVEGIGEVEVLIHKSLRCVSVGVNYDGRLLDLLSGHLFWGHFRRRVGRSLRGE